MPRKGENIRKRQDGRWEGRFKQGVRENGASIYTSVYGKTYKDVKEKLATAKQSKSTLIPSTTEKLFSEVLFMWAQANRIRLKGGSEQKYSFLIKSHILPELGGLKLSQISSARVNAFLMNKCLNGRLDGNGGLSHSYVNSIGIIIESAINFAVAEQMCPPLKTPIYKSRSEKKEVHILNPKQRSCLEIHLKNNLTPTSVGILISLYTGLRIGEICALSWNDIDFFNQILHVRHTIARVKNDTKSNPQKTKLILDEPKTKASKRDIPIPSILIEILKEYKKISTSEYIVSENERFVSPRTYEYRYRILLNACKVEYVNFHTLRHTFASRCVEVGVDIKSLSEILGHRDSSITLNTYVHTSMKQKRHQLNKLVCNIDF